MTKMFYPSLIIFKQGNEPEKFKQDIINALLEKKLSVLDYSHPFPRYSIPFGERQYSFDITIRAYALCREWIDARIEFPYEFPDIIGSLKENQNQVEMKNLIKHLFQKTSPDLMILALLGLDSATLFERDNGANEFIQEALRGKIKEKNLVTVISDSMPVLGTNPMPFEPDYQKRLKVSNIPRGRIFSEI